MCLFVSFRLHYQGKQRDKCMLKFKKVNKSVRSRVEVLENFVYLACMLSSEFRRPLSIIGEIDDVTIKKGLRLVKWNDCSVTILYHNMTDSNTFYDCCNFKSDDVRVFRISSVVLYCMFTE